MAWKNKTKEEIREYNRLWYSKNKSKRIATSKANRERIVKWYNNYKSSLICLDCGLRDFRCIEFHHRIGKKENNIATMVRNGCSINKIKNELKKCIPLCANCHRIRHY